VCVCVSEKYEILHSKHVRFANLAATRVRAFSDPIKTTPHDRACLVVGHRSSGNYSETTRKRTFFGTAYKKKKKNTRTYSICVRVVLKRRRKKKSTNRYRVIEIVSKDTKKYGTRSNGRNRHGSENGELFAKAKNQSRVMNPSEDYFTNIKYRPVARFTFGFEYAECDYGLDFTS